MKNIVDTFELRRYVDDMKQVNIAKPPQFLQVKISSSYDVIYWMSYQSKGLLSPVVAVDVVKFYHLVESVMLYFRGGISIKSEQDYKTLKQDIGLKRQPIEIASKHTAD